MNNVLNLDRLTENERLEIATLLIKAGYTVRMPRDKKTGGYFHYTVEYSEEVENE